MAHPMTPMARSAAPAHAHSDGAGPAAIAAARLEVQLRGLIRTQRLDLVNDRETVAALVADLVASDDELATASTGIDGELSRTVRMALERRLGETTAHFGPLQPYFDDPTIEEVWIK